MPLRIANLQWLRRVNPQGGEDLSQIGPRMYEALNSVQTAVNNIEQQTNADASAQPSSPPQLQNISVTGGSGMFHVSLTHTDEIYRGINYHVEYADNPHFTNPFPIDLGGAREWRGQLGSSRLYFRAAASYGNTAPSSWIYHGGAQPIAVSGASLGEPPLPTLSQGSGTGLPGQGLQGPGTVAYRSATGRLPVRSAKSGAQ